jgi:Protein of unknown function (DUF3318)
MKLLEPIETLETQRLLALLPVALRSQVNICQPETHSSTKPRAAITTQKVGHQFSIQIDSDKWQKLNIDQRNLMFWHEISRIQNRSIIQFAWEPIVIGGAFSVALLEIFLQNFWSLSFALLAVGLALNQLYQRRWGEQGLRELTAADQAAIELAMQAGYSFSQAYRHLQDALRLLLKQSPRHQRRQYQVRLNVLELWAERRESATMSIALPQPKATVYI